MDEGSSPLARGTRVLRVGGADLLGLIPARAGNTPHTVGLSSSQRAHPRSRGEHDTPTPKQGLSRGSSPLARGTQADSLGIGHLYGLIPARAGNTLEVRRPGQAPRAHPRSRGEHSPTWTDPPSTSGSSPLARGTPIGRFWNGIVDGLIPARAGNTQTANG